jgi:hypothetical protein
MFGFIAVDQHRASPAAGLGAWIGGRYDPSTMVLEGHEEVHETTCARVRGLDPLDAAGLMQTASPYFHPQISDDNTSCEARYTLDWHVQLPKPDK